MIYNSPLLTFYFKPFLWLLYQKATHENLNCFEACTVKEAIENIQLVYPQMSGWSGLTCPIGERDCFETVSKLRLNNFPFMCWLAWGKYQLHLRDEQVIQTLLPNLPDSAWCSKDENLLVTSWDGGSAVSVEEDMTDCVAISWKECTWAFILGLQYLHRSAWDAFPFNIRCQFWAVCLNRLISMQAIWKQMISQPTETHESRLWEGLYYAPHNSRVKNRSP